MVGYGFAAVAHSLRVVCVGREPFSRSWRERDNPTCRAKALEDRAVITNFKKLADALDKAAQTPPTAPAEELVAAIRADKERIERDIRQKGSSLVTIDGRTFKVVRPSGDRIHDR